MDADKVKRNYITRLLISPVTLAPFFAGSLWGALLGANGDWLKMVFAFGATAVVTGGACFTNAMLRGDKILEKAKEEVAEQERAERNERLNELSKQLFRAKEVKAADLLKDLRTLYAEFSESDSWKKGANGYSISQTLARVEELYNYCIKCMIRICEYKKDAQETRVDALRRKYRSKIEKMVESVEESRDILTKILEGFHELTPIEDVIVPGSSVSELGEELERHLRIAAEISSRSTQKDSIDKEKEEI
jgi:hypothetical protein